MVQPFARPLAYGLPYLAVLLGFFLFHSAWLAFALYQLGMVVILISVAYPLRTLIMAWRRWGLVLLSFGGLAAVGLNAMSQFVNFSSLNVALASYGLSGQGLYLFALVFVVITPTLEELYWRGWLGRSRALLSWSDLAFAGYHLLVVGLFLPLVAWVWLPFMFIGLTGAAILWRRVRHQTGGLMIAWLSHFVADSSVMIWLIWQLVEGKMITTFLR